MVIIRDDQLDVKKSITSMRPMILRFSVRNLHGFREPDLVSVSDTAVTFIRYHRCASQSDFLIEMCAN